MADNILKGTIKIDAPGVKETFSDIISITTKVAEKLKVIPVAAESATDGLTNAFSKITAIDLTPQIEAAKQKLNEQIDDAVNNALGLTDALDNANKVTFSPVIKSLNQLQSEMDELKTKILATTDITEIQKLAIQFGGLEQQALRLKDVFKSFSNLKVDAQFGIKIPENLSDQVRSFGGGVKSFAADLNGLKIASDSALPRVGNQIDHVTNKSYTARQAVQNLSNVFRDLPFAIGNPAILTSAFDHVLGSYNMLTQEAKALGEETGKNVSAFSLLKGAIGGSGGVLIGFTLLSSLATILGPKLFSIGDGAKSQADKLKEAKEVLDDYVDGLNDVTKATIKGEQNAQQELVSLKTLYDATQDANIPLKERKKLVDELQDQYPKYFKNISDEIILAGGAKKAYDDLSAAILASARARAAQDALVDIQKQVLAIEQKQVDNIKEQVTATKNLREAQKGIGIVTGGNSVGAVATDNREIISQREYNSKVKEGDDLLRQKNDLLARAKSLTEDITAITEQNPESLIKPTAKTKSLKPKFEKVNFFEDFLDFDPKKVKADTENAAKAYDIFLKYALENQKTKLGLDDLLKIESKPAAIKAAAEWWEAYSKAWKENRPDEFVKYVPSLDIKPKISLDKKQIEQDLQQGLKELSKNKIDVNPTVRVNVNQGLIDDYESFKSIGERIGRSIGGGFDDAFKKIFDDTFQQALSKGLSGDALENFKSEFTVVSAVAAQGIQGIADAFASFTDAVLQGKNGMQAFGEAIKGIFKSIAVEIVRDIILAGILSALTGGAANGGKSFIGALGSIIGGSHATGLKRVPKDGYIAELHKDEMVVPARQAAALRSVMNPDFSIPSIGFQAPQNIKLPTFSTASFSNINNAANTLRSMSKQTLDISVGGEFVQRGGDLVAVINRTQRQQNITF